MLDLARDQHPTAASLTPILERSAAAGYHAVALYLEHRFAYPSATWAAAPGCLTPESARRLSETARALRLRLIPFLNTLGHMEGFIRSEGGRWLAEGPGGLSLQMCPSRGECVRFARGLVEDVLSAFDDEWLHLGGDETRQLGQCPRCAARAAQIGKAGIYAEYFGPLCRWVLERGRRPCLWADMLLEYPAALEAIPRQTILFDWQYFGRPRESTGRLRRAGFDVVCCPSIQSYNSGWCFLDATRANIDAHAEDAAGLGALGVLVTCWEFTYFSALDTVLPLVLAAGRRLAEGQPWDAALAAEGGPAYARAAELLGVELPAASSFLAPGTWRQLREHLVMRLNPFSLWRAWRDEVCGAVGDELLRLCDAAAEGLPADHPLQLPIELHRVAVQWVRAVQAAAQRYGLGDIAGSADRVEASGELLERLRPRLRRVAEGGGSRADLARLDRLVEVCRVVAARLRALPRDGAWRPSFETLVHDRYVAGDAAAWGCGWD